MRILRTLGGTGIVVAGLWATLSAQTLRVTPLSREGRLLVSFTLTDGYTDEIRQAIRSGLQTTITYEVELRRASALWWDQTIAGSVVSVTTRYDNLTRRYQVSRSHDGQVDWTNTTDAEQDVRQWMTEFDKLPLFNTKTLEPNAEYYLRVRARTSPRNSLFPWPWAGHEATGRAKFTFLPG